MNNRAARLLLIPAAGGFLLSFVAPIILVGRLSLFSTDYVTTRWVGLGNYRDILSDRLFWQSFANAGFYILVIASSMTLFAYLLASGIHEMRKGLQSAVLFALYAPTLASGIISAMMWKWMFIRDGLINYLLGLVGIRDFGWFSVGWASRLAVCITMVATNLGGYTLLFVANMLAVPRDYFEQAAVDGASHRQAKRLILLPIMAPTVVLVSLLCLLSAAQLWETVMWLTNGGPAGTSSTPVYDAYLTGFSYGKHGMAAAKSVLIMLAIAAVSLVKRRTERWLSM